MLAGSDRRTDLCACGILDQYAFMLMSMDLSDVVFSKERAETFIRPDEETENMVSLEEALEVTTKSLQFCP